jgi:hypothetical protein
MFRKFPWATKGSSLTLRMECFLVFVITVYLFHKLGGNWLMYGLVMVSIDISMIGYLVNSHVGGLVYNIGHSYILPRIILLAALMTDSDPVILFALVWNSHISLDRALGYGLKHDSFHLTHLGPIGKQKKLKELSPVID